MRADDQDKSAPPPEKARKVADKLFLGPEFLTWLYFTLLEEGMALPREELGLPAPEGPMAKARGDGDNDNDVDLDLVQFAIGKRAVLKTVEAGGARVTLAGAGLDDNGEILQAIRRGAFLDTLALDLSLGHRVYSFTLRADDGGFVGVKLPDLFSEPEEDEGMNDPLSPPRRKRRPRLPLEDILALRMQCLDELEAVIDALFSRFITRRIARAWHTEDVAGIRKAVARGLKARLVDV
jgi:hypothetical protein